MKHARTLLAVALTLLPVTLLAAPTAPAPAPAQPGIAGELLRVVFSLVAVVAVILLAGWMGRRAQSRVRHGGRRIRCVEALAVGAKERVLLLEAGNRQLLVGVAPGSMRTLLVLDEPIPEPGADETSKPHFRDLLTQWRQRS